MHSHRRDPTANDARVTTNSPPSMQRRFEELMALQQRHNMLHQLLQEQQQQQHPLMMQLLSPDEMELLHQAHVLRHRPPRRLRPLSACLGGGPRWTYRHPPPQLDASTATARPFEFPHFTTTFSVVIPIPRFRPVRSTSASTEEASAVVWSMTATRCSIPPHRASRGGLPRRPSRISPP